MAPFKINARELKVPNLLRRKDLRRLEDGEGGRCEQYLISRHYEPYLPVIAGNTSRTALMACVGIAIDSGGRFGYVNPFENRNFYQ